MSKTEAHKAEKDKVGRPRGRPPIVKPSMPAIDMIKAIEYTKKAYEQVGSTVKTLSGMADAMNMEKGLAIRTLPELRTYGVIDQGEKGGWRITDLGIRAVKGDKNAVVEILRRDKIMDDLYDNFKDKGYGDDYIENHIKSKRYKIDANMVAKRFSQALDYINNLEGRVTNQTSYTGSANMTPMKEYFKILQLRFALSPPTKTEKDKLAKEVVESLEKSDDDALKVLASSIKDHKANETVLLALTESAMRLFATRYPEMVTELEKKEGAEVVEEEPRKHKRTSDESVNKP